LEEKSSPKSQEADSSFQKGKSFENSFFQSFKKKKNRFFFFKQNSFFSRTKKNKKLFSTTEEVNSLKFGKVKKNFFLSSFNGKSQIQGNFNLTDEPRALILNILDIYLDLLPP